ncbi:S9 family peptidase [Plantactinospora sp. KBS50]|uniref:alpha/beta hydrolase family protein n=1 Tax=Plantactinospora sp. KBS50 TaxID=2024580 RepID=UPI000BAB0BFC|nr:prolyl oligopeptidase family serine peptidase [Plantactinospora sp. KBS50]ASW58099.1 alpha/beta hydrolase [Plantactinospora sp. KBS50]
MTADPREVLVRPAPPPDATVRYGPHPDQVADLRLPARPDPTYPLVVVVHGGFWRQEYDRRHTGPLSSALAGLGYPVAQLEYRRTGPGGAGGWPATGDDVAAGVAALPRLLAERTGLAPPGDPVLLGHSAGGHLALWCAGTAARVGGVLALAPVADLGAAYRLDLDGGAVAALLGAGPDEAPDRYAAADPVRRVPIGVPAVIVHGERDRQVPIELSRGYAARARVAGDRVTLIALPDSEHFGLIDPLSPAWPQVLGALRRAHAGDRGIDATLRSG